ncbi:zinc finger and BTB domain-containing protein 24-like, partial [Anopheles maculipalpis]|uniref:zinc finger and BTB domain-containing protein 24-like n=1 Tax=Anopheles maculipalpis TaxID=1496333 RepID=UPI00215972B4
MKPFAVKDRECRLCMRYRRVKPLDTEIVRKIGTCFGIHINLDDATLPRNICRTCTDKVLEVKMFRDFYIAVQARLFIRRSNHLVRIERQPLVQVFLSDHETPKYIHPTNKPSPRESRQPTKISTPRNEREKAKPSEECIPRKACPHTVSMHRAISSPRSLHAGPDIPTSTEPALPRHQASPSSAPECRPTTDDSFPTVVKPSDTVSLVDVHEDPSNETAETEDFEELLQREVSLSANNIASVAIEKLELEVLETDEQQIEVLETEMEAVLHGKEELGSAEILDIKEEHIDENEFDSTEEFDSDHIRANAPSTVEVLETNVKTEGADSSAVQPKQSRLPGPEARRKRRKKISGSELYKSLLTDCSMCGKKIERNRLEGHMNRHYGRRPYSCPMEGCPARFHCKHACRLHVRCRHGSQTFKCETCGKEYKARRDLLGHIRETHVEPKFSCDVCGKMFTTRSRLKQHRFYHTGERNYPCHVCDMRFYSNFQLKVHMRTHTNSFPYACSVCKKDFRYRHMAKDHISKDHGIDTTLQKDWIIQYPEPDPEEVEVVNAENNMVRYNIQRLEEPDEDFEDG